MKFSIALCSSLVVSALAAPAVVWKKNNRANTESRFLHSSDEWQASDLLGEALDRASLSVVFLVGKASDGTESLTELASSGMLPLVAEKYNDATGIYHHVSGLESTQVMVKAAGSVLAEGQKVLQISMAELNAKLSVATAPQEIEVNEAGATITATSTSTSTKSARSAKREKALAGANVLMVTVDPEADAAMIDQTISLTIENDTVESVVLAGIRSLAEVKRERGLASSRKQSIMQTQGAKVMEARRQRRRRLDQEEEEGDQGDDANNNDDMTGVYYVAMTPNILAGLLFLGLFTVITWIGISCLGDITGQEVFVTKMPSIGREA